MGLTSNNRSGWLSCGLRGLGWVALGLAEFQAAGQSGATSAPAARAERFLAGRSGAGAAQGMVAARQQHAVMVASRLQIQQSARGTAVEGRISSLSAAWEPWGRGR
jgi:hypothetical protein